MIQCSWGLRGPDKLLPPSHPIQSCCSQVLPTAAVIWCREDTSNVGAFLQLLLIFEGNTTNAVMAPVARWQVCYVGMARNSVEKLISIGVFPVTENE